MGKLRAENAIKKTKTLRHPNVLRYIDSISLDQQEILVTEEAIPLGKILSEITENPNPQWIAYGLKQIASAIHFLNNQCNLIHGNISIESVFVTTSGDWKLSNFGLCSEKGSAHILVNNKNHIPSILGKFVPPECNLGNWKGPDQAFDAYQFALLIFQVFNPNTPLSELSVQNIPKVKNLFHLSQISFCDMLFFHLLFLNSNLKSK